ncbi:MAG: adenosylhomocysteinase [Candidatus Omnitrophota bacterium]|nr:MAG: adenosylhomocysteinase [Candidatus Omnitrophota bacterium]
MQSDLKHSGVQFDIKNESLKTDGKKRIEWALGRMPVLALIRERFSKEKPLNNIVVGACLHVTTESAALMITLKAAGAEVSLCASNPLSTQDDVAASLVFDYGINVFAIRGEDNKTYYDHINRVIAAGPKITLDDGADVIATIHKDYKEGSSGIQLPWASTEETTTGVIRLKALEKENKLLYPIMAVNDAHTKHLFDNRYGTGQSSLDGIIRATNKLIAGTTFVVCGYGWCSRGIAQKAAGLGANVIVTEVDPFKALEAVMDGFRVMPIQEAAKIADIIITATGDINVVDTHHFPLMKNGVLLANSGHFNVEINLEGLKKLSQGQRQVKPLVTEYTLKNSKKKINVLGEGRLVNLACAEGHPAEVMDLSFANQALSCEHITKNHAGLEKKVYKVPQLIDEGVARLKLKAMGIGIDTLTEEQRKYLSSWQIGT